MTNALELFNKTQELTVQADLESGLWPETAPLNNRFINHSPMVNYMMFNNSPLWRSLYGFQSYFDCFHTNPVVYAIIMIKAREYANMNIQVMKRNARGKDEVVKDKTKAGIPSILYKLLNKPNVLQSRWEFMQQRKIFLEVCGNNFTYGNFGFGKGQDVFSIISLMNVWPQYMKYTFGGKYFEATQLSDIISQWKFDAGKYNKVWRPDEILFTNKSNTELADDIIFGRSPMCPLQKPISNIDMAYESRNVMMRNRGMRLVFASGQGDGTGKIPLFDDDIKDLEKRWQKYGTLEGQSQAFFSPYPIEVTPIDQNVNKLGLFEEIATDALVIANAYGVPDILVKLYLQGTTFENQEASVRRLYQGTLIPEAEDDMTSLSTFLGLDDTDYYLWPDFTHVPALQESENTKEAKLKLRSDRMASEVKAGILTREEYRTAMEYGEMPEELKKKNEDGDAAALNAVNNPPPAQPVMTASTAA